MEATGEPQHIMSWENSVGIRCKGIWTTIDVSQPWPRGGYGYIPSTVPNSLEPTCTYELCRLHSRA